MHELAAINELVGKAGSYASLRFATDTADAARGALLQLVQERATEIETKLLFFELEWAALPDERAEELLAGEATGRSAPITCAAPGATGPTCSPSPRRRSSPRSRSPSESAWSRLFGELVAALRVPVARRRGAARRRAEPSAGPGPRDPPHGRRVRVARAGARAAHARVHLQHARPRQGGRGPAAPLPALAGVAQPRQRGLRRVGDGADRGRARPLRHPPALVSAQGPAAGHRPARRL